MVIFMKKALRQILKMIVQNLVLPVAYLIFCVQKVNSGVVILADGHCTKRPERMEALFEELQKRNYEVQEWYVDFQAMSYLKAMTKMLSFMKLYARANYVVISDNFLPVSSCKKRKATFVVQLWHGCGAFKKFGYDTEDDIPADYIGHVFKNYDLVPVSGQKSIAPFTSAMRLEKGVCQPIGVSATDVYFDEAYNQACVDEFYQKHPDVKGKRILLWAPTFRGDAGNPTLCGEEEIAFVKEKLGETWCVLTKYHPHMETKGKTSSTDIPTERLLPVIDVLVTDYSSIIFLYAIYDKPVVFFAPDLEEYLDKRGFYLDYETLPGDVCKDAKAVLDAIAKTQVSFDGESMRDFYEAYMSGCDGAATTRIVDIMETKRYRS